MSIVRRPVLAFTLLSIMSLASLPLCCQEQNGTEPEKKEKKFMIGFQIPIFNLVYEERIDAYVSPLGTSNTVSSDNLSFDLNVEPAANMVFGLKVSERWWLMVVFGFDLHFSGLMESGVRAGLGTRVDFPFRNGVGFCGVFFEYAYRHSPQEDPSTTHGINLLGFGGAEYLATDFFGIGAQAQVGYLWYTLLNEGTDTYTEGGWKDPNMQGVIFALLGSLSFYF